MRKRNIRNILCNEGIDEAKLNWTQCCYFIKSKNRFCNIAKSRNSEYCGNHCQAGETGEAGETGAGTREVKKCKLQGVPLTRCPCPVDPSHTVYLHNLNKHIKICNISTQNAQLSKQIYYRENCNSSSEAEDQKCEVITDPILSVDLDRLVDKVRVCFNNIQIQNNSIQVPTNKFIEDTVLSTVAKDQSSFSRLRHAQQDARIIETLIDSNLLWHKSDDPNSCVSKCVNGFARSTVYVELGAGRGMLGLAIHAVSPESTIVLVERSGQRHKAEKSKNINVSPDESDQQQSNSNKLIHRLRMDIRHCLISKLPGIYRDITPIPENDQFSSNQGLSDRDNSSNSSSSCSVKSVVIVAKHLCGLATDLAIRSLDAFKNNSDNSSSKQDQSNRLKQIVGENSVELLDQRARGLAIATCCHHACNWSDYTGKTWFVEQGFTEAEFNILKLWSSWATLNTYPDRRKGSSASSCVCSVPDEHGNENTDVLTPSVRPKHITHEEMTSVGRMIKRILDQGRTEYLANRFGMKTRQVQYCEDNLTPENTMIIATSRHDFWV